MCDFQNVIDKCEFSTTNCTYEYINFYSLHYCSFGSQLLITLPLYTIFILICFYLTGDTANKYLASALTSLSEKMKISQNLAGVTFLAFGNGAPDVISSIVASQSLANGIEFSVGSLCGAGIFVTSFVLATVVWFADFVKVNKILFIRDTSMFILALVALCLFSMDKKIVLWEAIVFFLIYLVYVIVAVIQDRFFPTEDDSFREEVLFYDEGGDGCLREIIQFNERGQIEKRISKKISLDSKDYQPIDKKNISNISSPNFYDSIIHSHANEEDTESISKNHSHRLFKHNIDSIKYRLKTMYFNTKEIKFSNLNWLDKLLLIFFHFPMNLCRDLTIPACKIENWNQFFFVLMPLSSTIFVISMTKTWSYFISNYYLMGSTSTVIVILIIGFKFSTYRNRLPDLFITLCLFSFTMAVMWIWFLSKFLVDILSTVGAILNIDSNFLAMTLLSFGNSVPDLTLNIALAKKGYGEMGIAGSIAGPLFNVLVGLGIPLIKQTIEKQEIPFNIFNFSDNNMLIIFICVVALAINLFRLLIQGSILNYKLTKSVSIIGFIIYLSFFILICVYSFII